MQNLPKTQPSPSPLPGSRHHGGCGRQQLLQPGDAVSAPHGRHSRHLRRRLPGAVARLAGRRHHPLRDAREVEPPEEDQESAGPRHCSEQRTGHAGQAAGSAVLGMWESVGGSRKVQGRDKGELGVVVWYASQSACCLARHCFAGGGDISV